MFSEIVTWWRRQKHLKQLLNQPKTTVVFSGINGTVNVDFDTLDRAVNYTYDIIRHTTRGISIGMNKLQYIQHGNQRYSISDICNMYNSKCKNPYVSTGPRIEKVSNEDPLPKEEASP